MIWGNKQFLRSTSTSRRKKVLKHRQSNNSLADGKKKIIEIYCFPGTVNNLFRSQKLLEPNLECGTKSSSALLVDEHNNRNLRWNWGRNHLSRHNLCVLRPDSEIHRFSKILGHLGLFFQFFPVDFDPAESKPSESVDKRRSWVLILHLSVSIRSCYCRRIEEESEGPLGPELCALSVSLGCTSDSLKTLAFLYFF